MAKEADLIIGIGTRYTDFTTSSKWIFQNPDVKFLNINIARFDAYKLDGVQVVADAKETLEKLTALLSPTGYRYRAQWGNSISEAKAQFKQELQRIYHATYTEKDFIPEVKLTQSCLTQSRVLGIINETLGENDIIVGAAGSLPGDLQRAWQSKVKIPTI